MLPPPRLRLIKMPPLLSQLTRSDPHPSLCAGYAIMASINIASGFLCLTSIPRDAGKKFLEYLHRWTSPSTSFDYQCLAATIAIMVGSDSGFRAIICRALDALRGMSIEEVAEEGKTVLYVGYTGRLVQQEVRRPFARPVDGRQVRPYADVDLH